MKIRHLFLPVAVFFTLILNAVADVPKDAVPLAANLTFFLQQKWGVATNRFGADEMICRAFAASGTNNVNYRNLPDWFQFFDFKLFNDKGQEVPKTRAGLVRSLPPSQPNNYDLHRKFKI